MKDYHSTCAVPYDRPQRYSWISIPVLPFLIGRPWDEHALAFVHALRPSYIRVTTGEETCDVRVWRVTITVDDSEIIQKIEQEVEVGLPVDWENGSDASAWADKTSL